MACLLSKVKVIYDPRPLGEVKIEEGTVIKVTPSGFLRIKTETRNELFNPYTGFARGWNTLRFEEV